MNRNDTNNDDDNAINDDMNNSNNADDPTSNTKAGRKKTKLSFASGLFRPWRLLLVVDAVLLDDDDVEAMPTIKAEGELGRSVLSQFMTGL